jgi:hypothetical protein
MSSEFILLWFIGSAGVITGVIAGNLWLDRVSRRKREREQLLKRLRGV